MFHGPSPSASTQVMSSLRNLFVRVGSSKVADTYISASGKAAHLERKIDMKWSAPKFIEVSCGMEINRYAQSDGDEPVLF